MPNGDIEAKTPDALNRVSSEQSTSAAGAIQYGYTYGHDLDGNLFSIQEYNLPVFNQSQIFVYDGANRLTDETSNTFGHKHYGYDSANNRVSLNYEGYIVTYVPNALNQLSSFFDTANYSVSFTYDNNGNRHTRSSGGLTDTYGYDGENRLTSLAQGNANNYAYTYDYRTRRLQRVENGVVTNVVFSGGVSVKEFQGNANTVEYIRGHEMGGGVGGLLYTNRSGVLSFDHYNSRGDVVAKTDANGSNTYQVWYDAFGSRPLFWCSDKSVLQDRQQANTKEEDPTGLLNEGFRYRDLETGTFITKDPIGPALMMPKEKWFVDGKSVSADEYEEALVPGVPQVGSGPTKTAKNTGEEADMHAAEASGESENPGQKSHFHSAAAGFPNLYTYVNQNPWTFFDPEGLEALLAVLRDGGRNSPGTMTISENGKVIATARVNENGYIGNANGLRPGTYSVLPKNNFEAGDRYDNGQPSVTAPQYADPKSKNYTPGKAGPDYPKGTVRIHEKSINGKPDSTGCVTADPKTVALVKQVMDRNTNNGGTKLTVKTQVPKPQPSPPPKTN